MAKLNTGKAARPTVDRAKAEALSHPAVKLNYEGGIGYDFSDPRSRLYVQTACFMVGENTYYRKSEDRFKDLMKSIKEVMKVDPMFILQLAVFARNSLFLRTVPMVLLGEAVKNAPLFMRDGRNAIQDYVPHIIKRADELGEVLAYVAGGANFGDMGGKGVMVPNALRKGLAKAMHSFDEYQYEKYNSDKKNFSMRDILRLVHPRPASDEESTLFAYLSGRDVPAELVDAHLPKIAAKQRLVRLERFSPEADALIRDGHVTWEVAVSKFGNRRDVWEACLPTMGYMAVLRNLRNMLDAGVDPDELARIISDERKVLRSKQLPFRFWSALKNIPGGFGVINDALVDALETSVANVPELPGKTLVAIDFSGSMDHPLSDRSSISFKEVGMMMGAIAVAKTGGAVAIFGERAAFVNGITSRNSILGNVNILASKADSVGHSTNAHLVLKAVLDTGKEFERIILVSDMICWDSSGRSRGWYGCSPASVNEYWLKYKDRVNPNARIISLDVAGYGNSTQVPDTDSSGIIIGGWAPSVYNLIDAWENGKDYMETIRGL